MFFCHDDKSKILWHCSSMWVLVFSILLKHKCVISGFFYLPSNLMNILVTFHNLLGRKCLVLLSQQPTFSWLLLLEHNQTNSFWYSITCINLSTFLLLPCPVSTHEYPPKGPKSQNTCANRATRCFYYVTREYPVQIWKLISIIVFEILETDTNVIEEHVSFMITS